MALGRVYMLDWMDNGILPEELEDVERDMVNVAGGSLGSGEKVLYVLGLRVSKVDCIRAAWQILSIDGG